MFNFLNFFKKSKITERISPDETIFRRKYNSFKSLLVRNNQALEILTELEHLLYSDKPFSLDYVTARSEKLIGVVYEIAEDINAVSGGKFTGLFDSVEKIGVSILKDLTRRKKVGKSALIIPLRNLSHESLDEVGGKAANLGEVFNRANLPVPQGFAVTAYACWHFMKQNRLIEKIKNKMKLVDVKDTNLLIKVTDEIREMILKAPLPADLEKGLLLEAFELERETGQALRLAVRSSATCEDSEATFAGQHTTVLNVNEQNLCTAYKEVVASAYSPRAVYYRQSKGYSDEDVVMAVLCVTMVDSEASGVMYTIDPNFPDKSYILISSAWGLGVSVVDGSLPTDHYLVDKKEKRLMEKEVAVKNTMLKLKGSEGVVEESVPPEMTDVPCLTNGQIMDLALYGIRLEEHYGQPLDIEWALNPRGRLIILQARPLNPSACDPAVDDCPDPAEVTEEKLSKYTVILNGGAPASPGVAAGQAYILHSEHNLAGVPQGCILIARQTSPTLVPVMDRVQAIITDVGSVTGHMASVAREFGIPTLVGTHTATQTIKPGAEITVDASNRKVYLGRVTEILRERKPVNLMKGSPIFKATQEALKKIAPLSLIDPKKENFTPEGCRTLHDVIRFAHEKGMSEMFSIGDDLEETESVAIKLRAGLPLNILVIDLGGGLKRRPDGEFAEIDDVASVPFNALLFGMRHEGVQWHGSTALDIRGFASIMAESVFRDPHLDGRLGGPNYAVISDEYLNFNTRLGYHFAVIDSFCGDVLNDNYITFNFKGGAADISRRSRRAGLIGAILKKLAFKVEIKGDMVRGELKKYNRETTREKLNHLGRLLGAVRLLDMVLSDDGQVSWYVDEFFKGNYTFARAE